MGYRYIVIKLREMRYPKNEKANFLFKQDKELAFLDTTDKWCYVNL